MSVNPDLLQSAPLAVIGLGYVGLPLAVAFGKQRPVVGFDINAQRIAQLQTGHDSTLETTPEQLAAAQQLRFTGDVADLAACRTFIVTVPTPVDAAMQPNYTPPGMPQMPSKCAENRSRSIVALVTITRRSGRRGSSRLT